MSSYWFNMYGTERAVATNVTSHCQDPMTPKMSVVTSSCIVPMLKTFNTNFLCFIRIIQIFDILTLTFDK